MVNTTSRKFPPAKNTAPAMTANRRAMPVSMVMTGCEARPSFSRSLRTS